MVFSGLATTERNNFLENKDYKSALCVEGEFASCSSVLTSPYSQILGVSVSSIGFITYLFVFLLSLLALFNLKDNYVETYFNIIYFFGFIFLFVTFIFSYISAMILNQFCTLCLLTYFVNISIFVYAFIFNIVKSTCA